MAGWIHSGVKAGTKLRFDDIAFSPRGSEILPAGRDYLAQVGDLLVKRPGVRIKLTGYGSVPDLYSTPAGDAEVVLNSLSEQEKTRVLALATARAEAIKQYFVQTYSTQPERLFVSSPEFDGKPASKPHAEISL